MSDETRTRSTEAVGQQLLQELAELRQRVAELEAVETERKRAEEKLQEREETLRALLNAPTESAMLVDLEGTILAINEVAAQRLGKRADELIGLGMYDYLPPDLAESRKAQGDEVIRSGKPLRFQDERAGKYFDNNIYPVFDAEGKVTAIAVYARDITETKQAEKALRESEERYRVSIESAPYGIGVIEQDRRFLITNPQWERLTGYAKEEIPDVQTWFKKAYPDEEYRRLVAEEHARMSPEEQPRIREAVITHKDGEKRICQFVSSSLPSGVRTVFLNDITERKRAEEALRTEKEFTDTALDAQLDTFFLFEPATSKALRWNRAFRDISGYTGEEIARMPAPASYYGPEDLERAGAFIQKVLEEGTGTIELELICKDSRKIPTEYRVSVINDDQGEPKYIISIGRDITERRQAEQQLQILSAVVEQSANSIAIIDREGKVEYANPTFLQLNEFDPDEVIGKNWRPFVSPHSTLREKFPEIQEAVLRRGTMWKGEVTDRGRSGEVVWREAMLFPIKGAKGEITHTVYTGVDITERKRAEEAMRGSEERLSSFMNSASDSFYLLDSDLNFVEINEKGLEIIGKSRENVIGKNITDIVPDVKESGRYEKHLEVMRTGQPFVIDHFVPHPVFGDLHFILKSFKVGDGLGIIASDITERKQAEEALRESEDKYRTLFETMAQGVVYQSADGRITSANPAAERVLGLTLDQMQGRTSVDPRWRAIHEDGSDFPGDTHPAMVALKTGKEVQNVVMGVFSPRKQDYTWININAVPQFKPEETRPYQAYTTFEDITGRKQAEEALRQLNATLEARVRERTAELQAQYARLDAILSSTTDGIVVTDREGNITQANPVAQTWLTEILPPEDAKRLQEAVRDLAMHADERPEMVLELTQQDLAVSTAPVVEEGVEEPWAAVVDIHDISPLKALDRMKTMFINNVAHELRTPVSTIKSYAYLMQRTPSDDEKWGKYLDALVQETDHQAQLVEDIMQISRIYTGRLEIEPRPTPLNELAEAVGTSHRASAQERGVTLEHRLMEPAPVVLADPKQMRPALNHLVGNAVRYTPEGGQVVVSTGRREVEGCVWATVAVSDTGEVIPAEDLPHIFERFFREEEPRSVRVSETGLRLMIVKGIVELHGGRVTVESGEGRGSTFTVWLPLTD